MATEQTQRGERFERSGDEPDSPTDMKGRSWFGVLKRTVSEFKEDNLTDWAAALTYYGILALFPGLLVLVCPGQRGSGQWLSLQTSSTGPSRV